MNTLLLIGEICACFCFAAALGNAVNLFWYIFNDVANNDEVPDKPFRPNYIVKELSKYD